MATFRLSRLAEADLFDIGAYTLKGWGREQATRYLDDLEACCRMLVGNPESGRACNHVRPGLRRKECEQHVPFYRVEGNDILISRILHKRMLPERHDTYGVADS